MPGVQSVRQVLTATTHRRNKPARQVAAASGAGAAGWSAATRLSGTTSAKNDPQAGRPLRLGGGGHSPRGAVWICNFGTSGGSIHTSGGTSRIGGRARTRWTSGCIAAGGDRPRHYATPACTAYLARAIKKGPVHRTAPAVVVKDRSGRRLFRPEPAHDARQEADAQDRCCEPRLALWLKEAGRPTARRWPKAKIGCWRKGAGRPGRARPFCAGTNRATHFCNNLLTGLKYPRGYQGLSRENHLRWGAEWSAQWQEPIGRMNEGRCRGMRHCTRMVVS